MPQFNDEIVETIDVHDESNTERIGTNGFGEEVKRHYYAGTGVTYLGFGPNGESGNYWSHEFATFAYFFAVVECVDAEYGVERKWEESRVFDSSESQVQEVTTARNPMKDDNDRLPVETFEEIQSYTNDYSIEKTENLINNYNIISDPANRTEEDLPDTAAELKEQIKDNPDSVSLQIPDSNSGMVGAAGAAAGLFRAGSPLGLLLGALGIVTSLEKGYTTSSSNYPEKGNADPKPSIGQKHSPTHPDAYLTQYNHFRVRVPQNESLDFYINNRAGLTDAGTASDFASNVSNNFDTKVSIPALGPNANSKDNPETPNVTSDSIPSDLEGVYSNTCETGTFLGIIDTS